MNMEEMGQVEGEEWFCWRISRIIDYFQDSGEATVVVIIAMLAAWILLVFTLLKSVCHCTMSMWAIVCGAEHQTGRPEQPQLARLDHSHDLKLNNLNLCRFIVFVIGIRRSVHRHPFRNTVLAIDSSKRS